MTATQYIEVPCIKVRDLVIPLWDKDVKYEQIEDYGSYYTYKSMGQYYPTYYLLNVNTKELSLGITVDSYSNTEFKVGQEIYYRKSGQYITKTKIVDIQYLTYDLKIRRGKDLEDYEIDSLTSKGVKAELNGLYAFKYWEAHYILENGVKTKWTHELYILK